MKPLTTRPLIGLIYLALTARGAGPLDSWTWRNPLPQGNPLRAVTYGGGQFVAVGWHGTVVTSPDGLKWTVQNSGAPNFLYGVAYGNGQFVAVGWNGEIVTSSDGINWTRRGSEAFSFLWSVAYGNGQFVAMRYSNLGFLTSPDGVNWTVRGSWSITAESLYGVAYGAGRFVAVGYQGAVLALPGGFRKEGYHAMILSSPDGANWTAQSSGTTDHLTGVAYGNGQFVAVATQSDVYGNPLAGSIVSSPDGVTWDVHLYRTNLWHSGVTYGNGQFVAVGRTNIVTSTDGVNWMPRNFGTDDSFGGVVYGQGRFVVVGSGGIILESGLLGPTITGAALSGTAFNLTVSTELGRNHVLEYKNLLDEASWTPLQTLTGTGSAVTFTDTNATGQMRFYRISVQ